MRKTLIAVLLMGIIALAGCATPCGKFSSNSHERDVEHLGQLLCELEFGCNYKDFEDKCGTGRAADAIHCSCEEQKTIVIP